MEKEKLFVAKEKKNVEGKGKGKNIRSSLGHMGGTGWYCTY